MSDNVLGDVLNVLDECDLERSGRVLVDEVAVMRGFQLIEKSCCANIAKLLGKVFIQVYVENRGS